MVLPVSTPTAVRPDLSEVGTLGLIALRLLTWQPPQVTRIGMERRRGRWQVAAGGRVPVDSQTDAWIGFWQTRGLVQLDNRQIGELTPSGWRAYRRLLGRGLTPLEQFHERWSQCADDDTAEDFTAAAAYANHCVGALTGDKGPAVLWLDHAERSLSALNACAAIPTVDLDALIEEYL